MKKSVAILLIVLFVLAIYNGVKAQELSEQVDEFERVVEDLQSELSEKEAENSEYLAKIEGYESLRSVTEKNTK